MTNDGKTFENNINNYDDFHVTFNYNHGYITNGRGMERFREEICAWNPQS